MKSAVFPEGMERLDPGDVGGSLAKVERYIQYMTERLEFAQRNLAGNVTQLQAGMAAMEQRICALEDDKEGNL